ncbi:hypothetical protein [Flavobacterium sp. AG291]|uniref:hypothetical protein n=1 Tax=Flavobacterium sp. AG291 TaxID=2184000 RepID=UPI000E0C798E|nr:hypothetical protein [Flavobacterium sp. AG291]RDI08536.1 hypothetical protein DEU42_11067 [Flavobacterium sp. AG291]
MGFHICISNELAIDISLKNGVYGNVGGPDENRKTIWGKVKDLYAIKPGDTIILYVKNPVSHLIGVFEVTSVPYICFDNLFEEDEIYPYRFNFKRKKYFPNPVPSFEFYSLVEAGLIESMITLSRDVNSTYRGIRQLFESEYNEILNLFYKYNPKTDPENFDSKFNDVAIKNDIEAKNLDIEKLHEINIPTSISFNLIPSNKGSAILEDVLHAYIVYNVLHNTNNVREDLGLLNINELILEAPIFKSMQFRSDILATFKHNERIFYYSFFELKKSAKIGIEEISQLMGYLKSFAASKSLPVNSYEGVYISRSFTDELIQYLIMRKTVENENIISLISYDVDSFGVVTFKKII